MADLDNRREPAYRVAEGKKTWHNPHFPHGVTSLQLSKNSGTAILAVICGMSILPMINHGLEARATLGMAF
jgi:hypothetical protein